MFSQPMFSQPMFSQPMFSQPNSLIRGDHVRLSQSFADLFVKQSLNCPMQSVVTNQESSQ
jgi:hypothetical protein